MNLANLDLNLLISLDALLQERSVTRAAARVGLSQPALSGSLARLRRHFGDELLVRVGNSYQLTPLGAHLKHLTGIALTGVERVFLSTPDFDPARTRREFSLMTSDYGASVAGQAIATVLSTAAPFARLRLHHIRPEIVDHAPESLREIDGLLLPHGFLAGLPHLDLHTDRWVCVVDAANPAVGDALTMENLAELPWVVTFHTQTAFTPAARQLHLLGVDTRTQVIVESFLAVPAFVAGTNRIGLLQERLARRLIANGDLRIMACPFDVVPLVEALWWHPIYERDPEHAWLRRAAEEAGQRIAGLERLS